MTLNEAIHRMTTCAPAIGWCPREDACFLVARTLQDYEKMRDSLPDMDFSEVLMQNPDQENDLDVEFYAPDVGFFLTKKPEFEFK